MKITFRIKFGEHFFSRVSRKKHLRPGDARTNLHLNIIVTRGQIRRKKKIQRCLAHSASYVSGLCSFHWDIHQVDAQFTGCHGDIIRRVGLHDLQLIMWYHRVVSMERKLSQKEANFKVSTWFNVSLIHLKILTMARDQTHQTIDFLSTRKTPFWLFSLNNCNAINKQIVRGWLHLERIPPFPLHQPAVNTW